MCETAKRPRRVSMCEARVSKGERRVFPMRLGGHGAPTITSYPRRARRPEEKIMRHEMAPAARAVRAWASPKPRYCRGMPGNTMVQYHGRPTPNVMSDESQRIPFRGRGLVAKEGMRNASGERPSRAGARPKAPKLRKKTCAPSGSPERAPGAGPGGECPKWSPGVNARFLARRHTRGKNTTGFSAWAPPGGLDIAPSSRG